MVKKVKFVLKGINIADVIAKIYPHKPFNGDISIKRSDTLTTNVDQLASDIKYIEYTNPEKKKYKIYPTMVFRNKYLPPITSVKCWWCRMDFNDSPLGMPISYNKNRREYVVDGIFCSFACCKAFLNENGHNPMYNDSCNLLTLMYLTLYNPTTLYIQPAPHWKLLTDWGGTLTRDEYKKLMVKDKIVYNSFDNLLPVDHYFDERV